jgi:hypothetical protein
MNHFLGAHLGAIASWRFTFVQKTVHELRMCSLRTHLVAQQSELALFEGVLGSADVVGCCANDRDADPELFPGALRTEVRWAIGFTYAHRSKRK